jgi:adenylate cyclase
VAILAADVVGYSRLIGADEAGTLAALHALLKDLVEPTLKSHRGRIVKLMGDGLLAEFASVVDAVSAAVDIQEGTPALTAHMAEDQRVALRIGINIGDVVAQDGDLFGDGVNIAARLQECANANGIAISEDVHRHLRGKLDFPFEDAGEKVLKNIAEPVRVLLWPASVTQGDEPEPDPPPTLPDKPSIAVLPFVNMSGDADQEYFSDGMTEDLTTALSRFDGLFVIARNSAFTYKGEAVDVTRVGRELGVRYVLEGSVRRSGNRVRINAQLIDAGADRHVWAERFDRQIDDVFELQDDIVARIASTVGPEITLAEIERARGKRPDTLDAWDHYLRAIAAYHRMTKDDVDAAISLLEKAIEVEPEFANAYALLGLCHAQIGARGWVRPVRQAYEDSRRFAEEAARLAPSSPETNQALAFVLNMTGEAEQAITVAQRAIDLNPNYAEAYAALGHALIFCGDLEEGLAACHRAERGNPRDSRGSLLFDAIGHAYFMLGDYEQAIEVSKKCLHQDPSVFGAMVTLAGSYACLDREADAKRSIDGLLRLIPRYNLRAVRKNPMFVHPELIEKLIDSLRLAGLPE